MFCPNCGTEVGNDKNFCPNCGAMLDKKEEPVGFSYNNEYNQMPVRREYAISERSIALAIFLTIITCGIYSLYWVYMVNEEVNILAGNEQYTNGALVILYSILTCGIYRLYWYYKMGQNCDRIKGNYNGGLGILMLILALVGGLGIINLGIIQDTINTTVRR